MDIGQAKNYLHSYSRGIFTATELAHGWFDLAARRPFDEQSVISSYGELPNPIRNLIVQIVEEIIAADMKYRTFYLGVGLVVISDADPDFALRQVCELLQRLQ